MPDEKAPEAEPKPAAADVPRGWGEKPADVEAQMDGIELVEDDPAKLAEAEQQAEGGDDPAPADADPKPKPADDDGASGDDTPAGGESDDDDPEAAAAAAEAKESERKAWEDIPEGMRKRIARQSTKIKDLEAKIAENSDSELELEAMKLEIADLKARVAEEDTSTDLDPDDFDSFDDYLAAVDKAKKDPEPKAEPKPEEKPKKDDTPTEAEFIAAHGVDPKTADTALETLQVAAETADPTLWEEAGALPNLSAKLIVSLSETDDPAKVLRHVVDNPDVASELSDKELTPFQLARKVAALEATMSKPKPVPAQDDRPKGDREPIEPVNSGGRAMEADPLEADNYADYEARMNKREHGQRKDGWS